MSGRNPPLSKTKTKDTMSFDRAQFCTLGLGSDGCHHYSITILVGTYLSDLLVRTLVVGRRQQSESIEAALDME